ncbi:hypothetical protein M5K25_002231 [Dendrobium thyrsiflorum]|uniref:X8 domain-containing protein n=1 Tax=Dendrobium thyrsiflorum TaxID=117978 RepID=A0ABD0VSB9_DENTH
MPPHTSGSQNSQNQMSSPWPPFSPLSSFPTVPAFFLPTTSPDSLSPKSSRTYASPTIHIPFSPPSTPSVYASSSPSQTPFSSHRLIHFLGLFMGLSHHPPLHHLHLRHRRRRRLLCFRFHLSSPPRSSILIFRHLRSPFPHPDLHSPTFLHHPQSIPPFPSLLQLISFFLSSTNSPFMLNLYPHYFFMRSRGIIPLDSALFKPLPPSKEEIDPNTLLHYTNLFDAMLDAAQFALRSLNFSHIPIVVTETGWPSAGDPKIEPFATKDNADTYNSNLIKHVLFDRAGTPLVPEQTASVYIYKLFNKDQRPGPESEKHWGLFYGNGMPVYLLNVAGSGGFLANDSTNRTICVAAEGADMKALQAALDWACGPGRANCSEIQPCESCY